MFKFNFQVDADAGQNDTAATIVEVNEDEKQEADETVETGVYSYTELVDLKSQQTVQKQYMFKRLFLNKDLSAYESESEEEEEDEQKENDTEENAVENKPTTSKLNDTEPFAFIDYVDSYQLQGTNDETLDVINKTHDLVPGKYEGGLKVWELSIDLARLIYNLNFYDLATVPNGDHREQLTWLKTYFTHVIAADQSTFNIFEIGCGHALPSLSVLRVLEELLSSANKNLKIVVYLQDFNQEIVNNITFENAKRFVETTQIASNIEFKFVYGDWRQILERDLVPANYFDLILTSETIYNSSNYKSLLNMFKKCLKTGELEAQDPVETESVAKKLRVSKDANGQDQFDGSGVVLLSAKTYYFGCGGNVLEFSKLAASNAYAFKVSANILVDSVVGNYQFQVTDDENGKLSSDQSELEVVQNASIGKEIIKLCL
jgi:hypothetical protein